MLYLERERKYGAGDIRINQKVTMDESVYSLAFVVSLSDEQITPYFDIIKGELIDPSDSESEGEEKAVEQVKSALSSLRLSKKVEEDKEDEFTRELKEQKQIKADQRNFEVRKQKRLNIVIHCYLCFLF